MKYAITKHSIYEKDRFYMSTTGEDLSPVQDKLLRLATKFTETHAEDILYAIKKVEEWKEGYFSALLRFREDGIECIDFFDSRLELEKADGDKLGTLIADDVGIRYIQNWLLKVEPGCQFNDNERKMPWGKTVTLVRVDLNRMGSEEDDGVSNMGKKHISELKAGEKVVYDGEVYTVTGEPYTTKTSNGREWNVEVKGGTENYLYASYFQDGYVPVVQEDAV